MRQTRISVSALSPMRSARADRSRRLTGHRETRRSSAKIPKGERRRPIRNHFQAEYNRSVANEAVNQVLADYYRDFSTLNVQSILPYFTEPSLLVGPQGVIPIPNHAALVAVFGPVMEALRVKGYGRSELRCGYVKSLSASAALMGGVAVRYKTDGHELDRVGA